MKNISLITGGSSGLGLEIAKELSAKGFDVAIIGRDGTKLQNAKSIIGKNALGYSGDIADEAFIKGVFLDLNKQGYYVDYVYNCAGVGIFGAPTEMNVEKVKHVIDTNVVGLLCVSYEACRNMQEKGGTIVNVMSTAGLKANPGETLYCASKWAGRGFTDALREFYKKSNIHIIGVYPGGMNTPFWKPDCGLQPDVNKFMDPNEVARVILDNLLGRKTLYSSDITIQRR